MKTQIINDSYNVTSGDVGEFKEEIIKLNKSTESVNAYITQSTILSFKNKEEIDVEDSLDKIRIYKFYAFDDETLTKMTYNEKTVNLKTVLVNGEENQKSLFLNEVIDSTGILIQYKDSTNRIYLDGISKYALKSLCERAGVRGERYTINSFFRDAYIAGGLITMPDHKANKMELRRYDNLVKKGLKFIRRKNPDNDYKLGLIVGVFSGDYVGSSTDILLKTYEYFEKLKSVGEISLDRFYLSQEKSQVSFYLNHLSRKYNKKYKIDFPLSIGIDTYKSDTGKLSLRADLFFEIYGIKYVFKSTSKKQNEAIKNKAFIDSIKRNLVSFIEDFYRKIVETKQFDFSENQKKVFYYEFLEEVLKQDSSIKAALGKTRVTKISESFYDYILDKDNPSSYYEFLNLFFNFISNRLGDFDIKNENDFSTNNLNTTMLNLYLLDPMKNKIYKEGVLNG